MEAKMMTEEARKVLKEHHDYEGDTIVKVVCEVYKDTFLVRIKNAAREPISMIEQIIDGDAFEALWTNTEPKTRKQEEAKMVKTFLEWQREIDREQNGELEAEYYEWRKVMERELGSPEEVDELEKTLAFIEYEERQEKLKKQGRNN